MCVKQCDCNNCYKKKTCADCQYCFENKDVDCNTKGIQGCKYKIDYPESEDKKYCCTCKWYAEFEGVCCNGDSEYRADFRCLDDTCEYWKSKGENMSREEAYSTMLDYVSSVGGCGAEYWSDKDADKMRECLRILMFGTDDLDEL